LSVVCVLKIFYTTYSLTYDELQKNTICHRLSTPSVHTEKMHLVGVLLTGTDNSCLSICAVFRYCHTLSLQNRRTSDEMFAMQLSNFSP